MTTAVLYVKHDPRSQPMLHSNPAPETSAVNRTISTFAHGCNSTETHRHTKTHTHDVQSEQYRVDYQMGSLRVFSVDRRLQSRLSSETCNHRPHVFGSARAN